MYRQTDIQVNRVTGRQKRLRQVNGQAGKQIDIFVVQADRLKFL